MLIRKALFAAAIAVTAAALPAASYADRYVVVTPPDTVYYSTPAPVYESIPAPREGFTWVRGYWTTDGGTRVWISGHWESDRTVYLTRRDRDREEHRWWRRHHRDDDD